jgi:hypothetical protein
VGDVFVVETTLVLNPETELVEAFCDGHEKTMEHRRRHASTP